MVTRTLYIAMLVTVSACAADDAGDRFKETARIVETRPSQELHSKVEGMFERGRAIRIRFTPFESMGRASYDRDYIAEHWKSAVTLRCGQKCSTAAPTLHDALSVARRVEPACPPRFAAMITFLDENDQDTGVVYVHESRQCVVIDNISYFVPAGSLSELIEGIDHLRW